MFQTFFKTLTFKLSPSYIDDIVRLDLVYLPPALTDCHDQARYKCNGRRCASLFVDILLIVTPHIPYGSWWK